MTKPDNPANEEKLLRRYLLGELNEQEQLAVEERVFADEDSYQQLVVLEDELRYDYAQGVLAPKQRERFEQRFLQEAGSTERVQLAKVVLNQLFERAARESAAQPVVAKQGWWRTIGDLFSYRSLAFASTTATAILGGFLAFEMNHMKVQLGEVDSERRAAIASSTQQSEAQKKLARELDQERAKRTGLEKELATRKPATQFLAFLLAPGLSRDIEGSKKLLLSAGVDSVRFELELKRGGYARYRIELLTQDGEQVWSQSSQSAGTRLQLGVPANILHTGDYMVEVKGVTSTGEIEPAGDYYFTLIRR